VTKRHRDENQKCQEKKKQGHNKKDQTFRKGEKKPIMPISSKTRPLFNLISGNPALPAKKTRGKRICHRLEKGADAQLENPHKPTIKRTGKKALSLGGTRRGKSSK